MKPILFNTEKIRAILDNRKTVTRRVCRPQPYADDRKTMANTQPYRPGDILYVREAWSPVHVFPKRYLYKADADSGVGEGVGLPVKWHPSVHMPRAAARIFLRVTDVRVERLQDITEEQAEKEGLRYWDDVCQDETWHPTFFDPDSGGDPSVIKGLSVLWDSTIKPADCALYGWDANPWVWVIEFEQISREEAIN